MDKFWLAAQDIVRKLCGDSGDCYVQAHDNRHATRLAMLLRERIIELNGATPLVKELADRCLKLEHALRRAREWGITSHAFSGSTGLELADWVDSGMESPLPEPSCPFVRNSLGLDPLKQPKTKK